jgi:hypothetical protein
MDSSPAPTHADEASIGAEVRESVLLLGLSIGVTAAVTVAAQAALHLLG